MSNIKYFFAKLWCTVRKLKTAEATVMLLESLPLELTDRYLFSLHRLLRRRHSPARKVRRVYFIFECSASTFRPSEKKLNFDLSDVDCHVSIEADNLFVGSIQI